jgi:tetratricopeptide (TPR) repeat protein
MEKIFGMMDLTNQNQHTSEFWDREGCALCESAHYEAAIAAFNRAISLDPSFCKSWNNRANALCGLKRYAEALASYDKAVAIQPNYHQAWFNRGLLLVEMMAYGNAVESYERAIAIYPDPLYLHALQAIWLKHKLVPA